jgi:hypothetical protein
MFNVAHVLSPSTLTALATHFRGLNPKLFGGASRGSIAAGKRIYEEVLPASNVPACSWRRAQRIRRSKIRHYTLRHNEKYEEMCCHYFVALSRQVVSWKIAMPQTKFGTHLATEFNGDSKSRSLAVHRCAELFSASRFLRT